VSWTISGDVEIAKNGNRGTVKRMKMDRRREINFWMDGGRWIIGILGMRPSKFQHFWPGHRRIRRIAVGYGLRMNTRKDETRNVDLTIERLDGNANISQKYFG
jgi:hypothetical protein